MSPETPVSPLEVRTASSRAGALCITVSGVLDAYNSGEFDRKLTQVTLTGIEELVVDLSALQEMTASGVQSVISLLLRSRDAGATVTLLGANAAVRKLLELSGLSSFLRD